SGSGGLVLRPLGFFQESCCKGVTVVLGINKRGIAGKGFCIDIGSVDDKRLDSMVAAVDGCQHKRGMPVAVAGIYLCTVRNQLLYDLYMTVCRCIMKRCFSFVALEVYLCPLTEQICNRLQVTLFGRIHQRCVPVLPKVLTFCMIRSPFSVHA